MHLSGPKIADDKSEWLSTTAFATPVPMVAIEMIYDDAEDGSGVGTISQEPELPVLGILVRVSRQYGSIHESVQYLIPDTEWNSFASTVEDAECTNSRFVVVPASWDDARRSNALSRCHDEMMSRHSKPRTKPDPTP